MLEAGRCRVETDIEELADKTPMQLAEMIKPDLLREGYTAIIDKDDPTLFRITTMQGAVQNEVARKSPFIGSTQASIKATSPAEAVAPPKKGGCSSKVCRLGDRECDQYWGCRDTCRVASERITSMETCPQPEG